MELAAILDWGKPFVTATYALEGDGPLVLEAYEKIEIVRATIRAGHIPNVNAVARRLCSSSDKSFKEFSVHYTQEDLLEQIQIKLYSKTLSTMRQHVCNLHLITLTRCLIPT